MCAWNLVHELRSLATKFEHLCRRQRSGLFAPPELPASSKADKSAVLHISRVIICLRRVDSFDDDKLGWLFLKHHVSGFATADDRLVMEMLVVTG
jgi:hypothetical protein